MANKKKNTPRWVSELPSEQEERRDKKLALIGGALFLLALLVLAIGGFVVGGAR